MKRILSISIVVLVLLMLAAIARVAAAQAVTDPLSVCEPGSSDNCLCDIPELPCYATPTELPIPQWYATGRLHVMEFRLFDEGPWGFSTGTYRSGNEPCESIEFPPDGCPLNGFFHITLEGDEEATFWLKGPAYDADGFAIFGTFDDRLLVTLRVVSQTCTQLVCVHEPKSIVFDFDSVTLNNGLQFVPAAYDFRREGEFGEWIYNFGLELWNRSLLLWTLPSDEPIVFHYSTVLGSSVGVEMKLDHYSTDVRVPNYEAAFSPHLFAYDSPIGLPRHYLPEPRFDLAVGVGASALMLIAWALRPR